MKTQLMAITLAITTALSAGAAFAEPHQHDGPQGHDMRHDQGRNDMRHDDNRRGYQQHQQDYRRDMPRPSHDWRKGGRVPAQYRGAEYRINDWRSHRLPEPPRGHRWVRVNGDYVLVAIATGVIAQILLGGR